MSGHYKSIPADNIPPTMDLADLEWAVAMYDDCTPVVAILFDDAGNERRFNIDAIGTGPSHEIRLRIVPEAP